MHATLSSFCSVLLASTALLGSAAAQIPASGLRLWLRADAGVSSTGGLVNGWTDQSGASLVFNGTTTLRPTQVQQGSTAFVRFQGGQQLSASLPFTLQSATIFAVLRYRITSSNNDYAYAFGAAGSSGSQMTLSRRNGTQAYHYDGSRVNLGGSIADERWLVTTQTYGDGGVGRHRLSIDGVSQLDTTATSYSANFATATLGNYTSGSFRFWGDLLELAVYDRVVSGAERTQIESYLAGRADLATVARIGTGCGGSAGVVGLGASGVSRPVLGSSFVAEATNVPVGAPAFAFFGFDDTSWSGIPLPFALDGIGATGCQLYVSIDITTPMAALGSSAFWSAPIPNDPALSRLGFHLQAAVIDLPATTLGLTFSNELSVSIGL
jgi:hypothetical protein